MIAAYANQVIATQGTTGLVMALGDWIPSIQVTKVKPVFTINSATSNLRVRLVYRTAAPTRTWPRASWPWPSA